MSKGICSKHIEQEREIPADSKKTIYMICGVIMLLLSTCFQEVILRLFSKIISEGSVLSSKSNNNKQQTSI